MKRYSLIICLVLILSLSGVASAQIVLGPPPAAVGAIRFIHLTSGGTTLLSTYLTTVNPFVGGMVYSIPGIASIYYANHAAFEFNLGATTFPTTMTANNFTAKLGGLSVTFATGSGAMNVDLFDMGDGTEDGAITVSDFNSTRGSRIARRAHTFGVTNADFNNVTVTDAVRNDLFGAGAGTFSGFILKPNLSAQTKMVRYDPATPTLTINPGVSPPSGGGGGGGGGGCFIATAAR